MEVLSNWCKQELVQQLPSEIWILEGKYSEVKLLVSLKGETGAVGAQNLDIRQL
jgi:hypothetical protein